MSPTRPAGVLRRTATTALVGVVAVAGVAGCGSKKSSSSSSRPASKSSAGASSGATKHYRPGEFCSKKKTAIYAAQGLVCVGGHLKKH